MAPLSRRPLGSWARKPCWCAQRAQGAAQVGHAARLACSTDVAAEPTQQTAVCQHIPSAPAPCTSLQILLGSFQFETALIRIPSIPWLTGACAYPDFSFYHITIEEAPCAYKKMAHKLAFLKKS
eukprot:970073-Pelagomonas_calceolata.AAC.2